MPSKRQKKYERTIDQHIGQRIKQLRMLRNMSQTALGDGVDLTFQQIQKYENGSNRVGGSRLWQFSQILDVPVSYFFEGLDGQPARKSKLALLMEQPETIKLVRKYYEIKSKTIRRRLYEMIDTLGG